MRRRFALWAWLALFPVLAVRAEEKILSFDSRIIVDANATIDVVETITVRAKGYEIKRGIYRDFPVVYPWRWGLVKQVPFHVQSVTRNGESEPYALEKDGGATRVRIGSGDVLLDPGEYTYEITYTTGRQLGHFDAFDQLYWNVTGNFWTFAIGSATATVVLPSSVPVSTIEVEGYTGVKGSKDRHLEAWVARNDEVRFETIVPLGAHEGLTIVVDFAKGHVAAPNPLEALRRVLRDNRGVLVMAAGLALLLSYYLVAWLMVGKDPARGAVVPHYEPPPGIGPSAARYLMNMGYDSRCFAAALINLGVLGWLKLNESNGAYTITRRNYEDHRGDLSPEENHLYKLLLLRRKKLKFKPGNHNTISKAIDVLQKKLAERYEREYFVKNTKYWLPGILITMVSLGVAVFFGNNPGAAVFMAVWLTLWSIGVIALVRTAYSAWRTFLTGTRSLGELTSAVGITLFSLPFVGCELFVLGAFAMATSPLTLAFFVPAALVVVWFHQLMKAPTRIGRKAMDQLEGFRLYLSVAEADRLRFMHPPDRTPELFERFLPYALALDVDQAWAEYFADVIDRASGPGRSGSYDGFRSTWYAGSHAENFTSAALLTGLGGSLAAAVSSSSSAPGSSSGSSGGGSSGGGGGGGGGGGW